MHVGLWVYGCTNTNTFLAGRSRRLGKLSFMPSQSSRLKRHASSPSNEVDSPSSKRIYGTDTSVTVDDLQSQIVANLQQHATKATKDWFTNYVKVGLHNASINRR